jgi:hypothetical protein
MSDDLGLSEPGFFTKALLGLLSLAFALWAWVVKGASSQILNELQSMRRQIDINSQRLSRLEGAADEQHSQREK